LTENKYIYYGLSKIYCKLQFTEDFKAAVQTGPLELLQFIVSFAFKLIWSLNTNYPDCVHLSSTCDWTSLSARVWYSPCLSSVSKTSVHPLRLTQSSPANSTCLCPGSYPWCLRGRNNTRVLLYFTFHMLYTNDHVNRLYKATNTQLLSAIIGPHFGA
jgi:hypothetical protein